MEERFVEVIRQVKLINENGEFLSVLFEGDIWKYERAYIKDEEMIIVLKNYIDYELHITEEQFDRYFKNRKENIYV